MRSTFFPVKFAVEMRETAIVKSFFDSEKKESKQLKFLLENVLMFAFRVIYEQNLS